MSNHLFESKQNTWNNCSKAWIQFSNHFYLYSNKSNQTLSQGAFHIEQVYHVFSRKIFKQNTSNNSLFLEVKKSDTCMYRQSQEHVSGAVDEEEMKLGIVANKSHSLHISMQWPISVEQEQSLLSTPQVVHGHKSVSEGKATAITCKYTSLFMSVSLTWGSDSGMWLCVWYKSSI